MSNAKKAEPAAAAELFILHDQVHDRWLLSRQGATLLRARARRLHQATETGSARTASCHKRNTSRPKNRAVNRMNL
jgi:hypothetical protein